MASADPVRRSAMIRFQTYKAKLPTRSAAGRRGRISTAASVAAMTSIAHILSACSSPSQSVPVVSAALYPDLNDPPPSVWMHADEAAQIKAKLIALRDDQERVAEQQTLRHAGGVEPSTPTNDEPPVSAEFTLRR
jgi:hypothetical protein